MPRYFFDIHDGTSIPDHEGIELESADAARKQVWSTLPMMAAQRQADGGNMACQFRTFATREAITSSMRPDSRDRARLSNA